MVTPEIITMAPLQDHHPRDSNLTLQAILVPTQAMVSTVTTRMDTITQEARLLVAQAEASGPAWEQEEYWDISLAVKETSPTTITPPLSLTADVLLLEAPPLPLGHALLQVLEEPREDRSCGGGHIMDGTENNKGQAQCWLVEGHTYQKYRERTLSSWRDEVQHYNNI